MRAALTLNTMAAAAVLYAAFDAYAFVKAEADKHHQTTHPRKVCTQLAPEAPRFCAPVKDAR